MTTSREQFESAFEEMKHDRFSTNEDWAWKFWQASRAALVVELPGQTKYDDPLSAYQAINDCANAMVAAGITVKGDS